MGGGGGGDDFMGERESRRAPVLCAWLCFIFFFTKLLWRALNSPNNRGFYVKMNRFSRVPLKQGLRVDFKEKEGGFRKNTSDVRPEAVCGLLVG